MKKTNDELNKDFERELEKTNIPFKGLLQGKHYRHLLKEYTSADLKPSLDLYLCQYFSEQEIKDGLNEARSNIPVSNSNGIVTAANFVAQTPFETRLNELSNKFYKLVRNKQLPE